MTFSLKQYNKNRQEYSGEPKGGEVWETIDKSNPLRPRGRIITIVVLSNIGSTIRAYVCYNQPIPGVNQYEIKDAIAAGVFDKVFVDLNAISIPREKLTRRLGKLSGFDRNLVRFG